MMTNDLYLHSRDKHDYIYYDTDGVLKYNSIKETVENNINSIFVNTYEILIADFKYSVDKLVNLFKEDINDYEDNLSTELIYYFINCVMAFTFEENENEAIMELYEWLKINILINQLMKIKMMNLIMKTMMITMVMTLFQ